MSRRDTIIIAVLINTGLLAALFIMAMHTESSDSAVKEPAAEISALQTIVERDAESRPPAGRDEIDEVLRNYSASRPSVASPSDPERQPKAETPSVQHVEVIVKRGDTLERIARANGVTVNAIMRANHILNERIDIGQTLLIPIEKKNEAASRERQTSLPVETAAPQPQYYTIKSGDNPWKIAKQFHVKFDELLKLNDLDEAKARNLKPGDVLRVK